MKEDNIKKLNEVFVSVLELDHEISLNDLTSENYKKWDSLAHVLLIAAIESEFDINIEVADYENFTSYPSIISILEGFQL
jgi:acyl carrier protein